MTELLVCDWCGVEFFEEDGYNEWCDVLSFCCEGCFDSYMDDPYFSCSDNEDNATD